MFTYEESLPGLEDLVNTDVEDLVDTPVLMTVEDDVLKEES